MSTTFFKTDIRSICVSALVLGSTLALTACSGGGGSSSGTSSATAPTAGTASGFVTGFGSVVVDGVHYDDSQAALKREDDAGTAQGAKPSDFKIGQHVELDFSTASGSPTASKISVSPELVGSVTAIDLVGQTFTVAGQTIKPNADSTLGVVTVFDGYTDLSAVKVGDRVEVHGIPQGTGASTFILATRIEHLSAGSGIASRVTGTVSNLSADGRRFQVGATTIVLTNNTAITPTNLTLTNGQHVKVFSRTAIDTSVPTAPVMTADAIRIHGASDVAQSLMRVAGLVSQWTSSADFYVDDVHVNATAAASSLPSGNLNGIFVRVQGTYDGTSKLLTASSVKVGRDIPRDSGIELKGAITDFVSLDSFKVRNTAVQVVTSGTGATQFIKGAASDLQNGIFVEIKGKITNNILVATSIEVKQPDANSELEIMGSILSIDSSAGTLSLKTKDGTQSVKFSTTATSCDDNCKFDALVAGSSIKVEGYMKDGVLVAREISLMMSTSSEMSSGHADGHNGKFVEIGGKVGGVTTSQFTLNGLVIHFDASTLFKGGSQLANGQRVEAKLIQQPSGDWYALVVKVNQE